jgi:hypothetical protein
MLCSRVSASQVAAFPRGLRERERVDRIVSQGGVEEAAGRRCDDDVLLAVLSLGCRFSIFLRHLVDEVFPESV